MADKSKFDSEKYSKPVLGQGRGQGSGVSGMDDGKIVFVDVPGTTDGLANNAEAVLSFQHTPSGKDVFFKAFIDTFTETYSSNFNEETVFGRTDPIVTFKNTTKRVTLSWKIPAETMSEAYENLEKVQSLSQFLYPTYESIPNALTLSQTPLLRLKVMNLLSKTSSGTTDQKNDADVGKRRLLGALNSYRSTSSSDQGILGVITSMSVDHNLGNLDIGVLQTTTNTILPKMIFVSIDFIVLHEETLGWGRTKNGTKFNAPTFPYNINEIDTEATEDQEKYGISSTTLYREFENVRRKRRTKEQDCDNERAAVERNAEMARQRYSGMFGERRYKRDMNRVNRLNSKKEALRMANNGETLSKRKQAKLAALSDITSGRTLTPQEHLTIAGCYDDTAASEGTGRDNPTGTPIDVNDLTSMDF